MVVSLRRLLKAFIAIALLAASIDGGAVPAKRGNIKYVMPDGSSITVKMYGDERHHFFTSTDGYALLRTDSGVFNYAKVAEGTLRDTGIRATEVAERTNGVRQMLAGFDKRADFETMVQQGNMVRQSNNVRKQKASRIADESKLSTFPCKGSPKLLCILVDFQDTKFTLSDPYTAFKNQLTQPGYSEAGATGSILDYFTDSSNGQFTPQLDLYGPVTLPYNMSYYGGNDEGGNDKHPADIVPEACSLIDGQVDFTQYDNDNDGVIDNVYIFYAGYGEADGGPKESIWPHSWDMTEASNYEYYFDGKKLNHYACSNELRDGGGSIVAGIGVFCHEFSHVMGLPDLYSTSYTSAFTPGEWSVMDYGSYCNKSRTPPTHTAYERYCFGWVEPNVLDNPQNVTMRSMTHIGHYNDVYMIKTPKANEYFILENRQQDKWDKYIPGHGLLVWHIDFVPDIWNMNIVNVSKQYVDIVEADNEPSYYSIDADPFPGTAGVTSFTDDTKPSMTMWDGSKLFSPITEIKEDNGVVTFMFKGGEDIFDPVVAAEPNVVKAGGFTAAWTPVAKATGYLLSVYTKKTDGEVVPLEGYTMKEVGNVAETEVKGLTPSSTYYYNVRATNGKFYSKPSNEVTVQTLAPTIDFKTVVAKAATAVTPTSFVANWSHLEETESYTISVFSARLGVPFVINACFTDNAVPDGWETDSKTFDSRSAYSVETPSLRLSDGQWLTTQTFRQDVRSVSFWYRGNSSVTGNSIEVLGRNGSQWDVLAAEIPVTNVSGGQRFELTDIDKGYRQVKIVFHRPTTGYVYIDDVAIGYGGNIEEQPISGYTDREVGNKLECLVEGLTPGQTYSYSVIAHKGELQSKESARVSVTLPTVADGIDLAKIGKAAVYAMGNGQIAVRTNARTTIAIYDTKGVMVNTAEQQAGTSLYSIPGQGIYIVKADGKLYKIRVAKH